MSSIREQIWDRTRRRLHPIFASELVGQAALKPFVLSASDTILTVGTNNVYGPELVINPPSPFAFIWVEALRHNCAGAFASGETITIKTLYVYEDGTSRFREYSYTVSASTPISWPDPLIEDARLGRIVQVKAQAKTNQASTSVQVSHPILGFYY